DRDAVRRAGGVVLTQYPCVHARLGSAHPEVPRRRGAVEGGRVVKLHVVVHAIEAERLCDLALRERVADDRVGEHAALNVVRMVVAGYPTYQPCGRRGADLLALPALKMAATSVSVSARLKTSASSISPLKNLLAKTGWPPINNVSVPTVRVTSAGFVFSNIPLTYIFSPEVGWPEAESQVPTT